ncbi:MAG: DegT/DnrJ/EryC1/StrS family aminotransferase [Clostridia bacterium]|nr:DegT/DnrJ/EryC1/StrS family aminotransferase [Clostridia bacterium]
MNKPIYVTESSLPPFEDFADEIRSIWETHRLTNMGPKHEQLRAALKDYLGVEEMDLLTNGHMALELTMQAMNLRGEVITTPFTFISTTHAIVRNGLDPVFCDIDPDDFTLDTEKLEELITDRTTAIVPVHVYGNVCKVEEIDRIAKKYGLKVIYDAAHAFGCTYKGKGIGSYGDASCFSFHATKVYNTVEGGAVSFRGLDFWRSLYKLKNFGIRDEETVVGVGANAKMNELCAAMGICNLRRIDEDINRRKKVAARYRDWLENVPGVKLNPIQQDVKTNYSYFPVVVNEKVFGSSRNEIMEELARHQIYARKYFYPLTSEAQCYEGMFDVDQTPVARSVSKRVMTLPIYPSLAFEDVDRICKMFLSLQKKID